ncbi:MAG: hypothetical protein Q7T73_06930 [Beijerinckiaceae bacterium]|nr:hypothetical protein [Beijerinckiaceae bacterium]
MSQVTKSTILLSKEQIKQLQPSKKLDEAIDKLKFGLPVKVQVPQGGQFVNVAACIAVEQKDGQKVKATTVVLPPIVMAVKAGQAKGTIPVDPKAAKALSQGDAVKAGICTTSAVVESLPDTSPQDLALLLAKIAQQQKLAQQFGQTGKTIAKLENKVDDAKGKAKSEAQKDLRDAEEKALKQRLDAAKAASDAMTRMLDQIAGSLKQMQDAKVEQMRAFTR